METIKKAEIGRAPEALARDGVVAIKGQRSSGVRFGSAWIAVRAIEIVAEQLRGDRAALSTEEMIATAIWCDSMARLRPGVLSWKKLVRAVAQSLVWFVDTSGGPCSDDERKAKIRGLQSLFLAHFAPSHPLIGDVVARVGAEPPKKVLNAAIRESRKGVVAKRGDVDSLRNVPIDEVLSIVFASTSLNVFKVDSDGLLNLYSNNVAGKCRKRRDRAIGVGEAGDEHSARGSSFAEAVAEGESIRGDDTDLLDDLYERIDRLHDGDRQLVMEALNAGLGPDEWGTERHAGLIGFAGHRTTLRRRMKRILEHLSA